MEKIAHLAVVARMILLFCIVVSQVSAQTTSDHTTPKTNVEHHLPTITTNQQITNYLLNKKPEVLKKHYKLEDQTFFKKKSKNFKNLNISNFDNEDEFLENDFDLNKIQDETENEEAYEILDSGVTPSLDEIIKQNDIETQTEITIPRIETSKIIIANLQNSHYISLAEASQILDGYAQLLIPQTQFEPIQNFGSLQEFGSHRFVIPERRQKRQSSDSRCVEPFGDFADSSDCSKYVSCWDGRGFSRNCGHNMVFHPVLRQCQSGASCPGISNGSPPSGEMVRLEGGGTPSRGRLVVPFGRGWNPVSASSFTQQMGQMACAALGFPGMKEWNRVVVPGGRASITNLNCNSGHSAIGACTVANCANCNINSQVAFITCRTERSSLCPNEKWAAWKGSCYLNLDNFRASRDSGRRMCQDNLGELVNVKSQEEHAFVSNLIKEKTIAGVEFWTDGIGQYINGQNSWNWEMTGESVQYSRFWPGWNETTFATPPPTPERACLVLKESFPLFANFQSEYASGFYFFSAASCNDHKAFICKTKQKDIGCIIGDGSAYRGRADVSFTGRQCLKWSDPLLNSIYSRTARTFASDVVGDNNYCRNPDGDVRPWCFVGPEEYEYCDIPACSGASTLAPADSTPAVNKFFSGNSIASTQSTERAVASVSRHSQLLVRVTPSIGQRTTRATSKPNCRANEIRCSDGTCLAPTKICDGQRQCPSGEDERLCKRFVQQFRVKTRQTLINPRRIGQTVRVDIGVCAKYCLDRSACKGFIYRKNTRQCTLSRSGSSESGIIGSSGDEFYEHPSRASTCNGGQFTCSNSKCINSNLKCNAIDNCGDNSDEFGCPSTQQYQVRLVDGQRSNEGNIQVKVRGEWGYVCDDGFDFRAADLVCQHLGYSGAETFTWNDYFGKGRIARPRRRNAKIWLDDIKCTSTHNSFLSCNSGPEGVHDCAASELAGVICRTSNTGCSANQFSCGGPTNCISRSQVCDGRRQCSDGRDEAPELCTDMAAVRLEKRASVFGDAIGTLFVKHNGEWGTVCDDQFKTNDAKVVCRSLGYETGWAIPYPRAFFGRGSGKILLDQPSCSGRERWLGDCPGAKWGVTDCDHGEDVGVLCSDELEVRLVGGPNRDEGRVEIKVSGIWGTVCDDDFDDYDAKVVCRMLGYRGTAIAHKKGKYQGANGQIWLDSLDCLGSEKNVMSCKKGPPGKTDCEHKEDVAVTCSNRQSRAVDNSLRSRLPTGCGRRHDSSQSFLIDNLAKIIGGRTHPRRDAPWLASLLLTDQGSPSHNCGGVILSEYYLLTAAHCFRNYGKNQYIVRAGEYNRNSHDEGQQDFTIEKLWIHDEYDTTVEYNNDIALLKVARNNGQGIRFGASVQPVCLPSEDASYGGLNNCYIAGWGTTTEKAKPIAQVIPRGGRVNVFAMDTCTRPGSYDLFEVTSGMVCAGTLDGSVDTCTGDSGGPLTCERGGRHVLYGITSWGKGCGRPNQPGMYTKITKFLRWINEHMR